MIEYAPSQSSSFLLALLSSLVVASPFVIAPLIFRKFKFTSRLRADLSSFSAGIFLGAVAFSIFDEAVKLGDIFTMGFGFGVGAITFSLVRFFLQKVSKTNNKNYSSENTQLNSESISNSKEKKSMNEKSDSGSESGQVVIVGTLADSHPETLMIGIMIVLGIAGLLPTVLALFIGNFTATSVGTRQLMNEGKDEKKVLKKWFYVFLAVFVGGIIGFVFALIFDKYYLSIVFGFAAGALVSFVTEELIPYAYKKVNWHIGLSAALGIFISFSIFEFL